MTEHPGFVSLTEYLQLPHEPEAWLIEPLIPVGGCALLYSPAKVGKSALAIQLAHALIGGATEWLGFHIPAPCGVLYLQLDTPRTTWRLRFLDLQRHGLVFNDDLFKLADRECLQYYPFNILKPQQVQNGTVQESHAAYLRRLVQQWQAKAVILDTLRECHTGDENSSMDMQQVIANLVGAVYPAALIIISHARKPNPDMEKDIITDHRGSYVVDRMDVIMRLTQSRLYYKGRSIEEGFIPLECEDFDGTLLWRVKTDPKEEEAINRVLSDPTLTSLRAKGRALAPLIHRTPVAATSLLQRRRHRILKP